MQTASLKFAGKMNFVPKLFRPPRASARTLTDNSNKSKLDSIEKNNMYVSLEI